MKKVVVAILAFIVLGSIAPAVFGQGLDQYGGSLNLQCGNGSTGNFYAQEIGNRWWLCDPLGNAFWSTAVFNVWEPGIVTAKYGGGAQWGAEATARLKSWGFNTVDGGSSGFTIPMATNPAWPGDHTQPNKMADLFFNDALSYPPRGPFSYCSNANLDQTKPFGSFDDPTYWSYGTVGVITLDDPFDPCFSNYVYGYYADPTQTAELKSPWIIGVEAGEGDYEKGWGAGPKAQDGPTGALNTSSGFNTISADNNNANLALAVLMSSPWGTYNNNWSRLALRTREVYVKQEMANWLQGDGQVAFFDPTSASSASGTVTMTFNSNVMFPYAVGDKLTVQACSDANFNGSGLTVLTVSSSTITYTEPVSDTASGVNYCVASMTGAVITGAALASGVETVTMATNPYKTGDIVTITGVSPAAFNTAAGTGCGVTAYTATSFTCTNGSGSATYTSGGMASSGPGYTLAGLNTAWGSNYTTWGTTGTNYVDTISTQASPTDCNRTTWACKGTLSHVPDMFSVWLKDNGVVVAGGGTAGAQTALFGPGGGFVNNYCSMTQVVDTSGSVTVTCAAPINFTVGEPVLMYMTEHGNPFGGGAQTVTADSGNTFSFTSGAATFTVTSASSLDFAEDETQIDFSTGNFTFKFPASKQPGVSDTITVDYYSGGFAHGTGFLDEAGQHSWIPTSDLVSMQGAGTTDAFRNDMNNFIYHFTSDWLNTARDAVKSNFPNIMFLGTNEAAGSWCAPARVPVLRAVGEYVDMAPLGSGVCNDPTDQAKLDYTEKYLNNLPIMYWTAVVASGDNSVEPLSPTLSPGEVGANQAARGNLYFEQMEEFLNLRVDPGNGAASGQYPIVGIHLWDGGPDDPGQGDWGLTTYPDDNAYNGQAASQYIGTDAWGQPTGGEKANYGDSLDAITRANHLWLGLIPRPLVKTSSTP